MLNAFLPIDRHHPDLLWDNMLEFYPADAAQALDEARSSGKSGRALDLNACRRLLQQDRAVLVKTAAPIVNFASKRLAHHNPTTITPATFRQLDRAIDVVKRLTEKYEHLIYRRQSDLLAVMRDRRLPDGWDRIFLKPWATREVLDQDPPLGEREPPLRPG
jgi:hypothetical protein